MRPTCGLTYVHRAWHAMKKNGVQCTAAACCASFARVCAASGNVHALPDPRVPKKARLAYAATAWPAATAQFCRFNHKDWRAWF